MPVPAVLQAPLRMQPTKEDIHCRCARSLPFFIKGSPWINSIKTGENWYWTLVLPCSKLFSRTKTLVSFPRFFVLQSLAHAACFCRC